jgi:hypothetical protein
MKVIILGVRSPFVAAFGIEQRGSPPGLRDDTQAQREKIGQDDKCGFIP